MPPTPPKGIRDLLRDFGPLIAASVAVGVWLNQRHLQKQHLKQNLFEKRWKVYAAIQDYLMALLSTGEMDLSSTYGQFRHDTDPGEVLFNKRAWEHITALGIAGMKYGPASRYEKPPV